MTKTRLKDLIRNSPVHEREIAVRTYPLEDERLIVEGWLKDTRSVSGYHWDGQPNPAGVVHWMCVRLLVGGWPITILDAEAEMPGVPHELCQTTRDGVKRMVGIPIISGYGEAVRERLGGVLGCAHLTHLVTTMGPAALHGYWTQHSRKRRPLPRSMEGLEGLETLINSCRLWREDGPFVQEIRETIQKKTRKTE
jgi:hypothetical protein